MQRKRVSLSTRVPQMLSKGTQYQPDFILAIKEGRVKVACIEPTTSLSPLIYQLEEVLDLLKDIRWEQNKKKR